MQRYYQWNAHNYAIDEIELPIDMVTYWEL